MPPRRLLVAGLIIASITLLGCLTTFPTPLASTPQTPATQAPFDHDPAMLGPDPDEDANPRVVISVPDSGINPYHEAFYRPHLTEHPCTYLDDFPCDIEELPLSVGEHEDYEAARQADAPLWEAVEPGTVYWIPRTNIVAAACHDYPVPHRNWDGCILDNDGHGTASASAAITENPDALLAIEHGGPQAKTLEDAGIPIDVHSISWHSRTPSTTPEKGAPIYVLAAGNGPWSTLMDGWAGHPSHITVGGAHPHGLFEEPTSARQPDVVSYHCRPVAEHDDMTAWRERCGTSFSTPTVAGALSKVILDLRERSGYTGTLDEGSLDPLLDVTVNDLREAMNQTATYEPTPQYVASGTGIPLDEEAPWMQWGWGFYDGTITEATLAHLTGDVREKPEPAQAYMETQQSVRTALYEGST